MNIFEFDSYKEFLKKVIADNKDKRAFQKQLALAASCQPSYLSQALNSKVNITSDHAYGLAKFLKFTEDEMNFFLLLVNLERASQLAFKKFILEKMERERKKYFRLTNKIKEDTHPDALKEFANIYYSSWHYLAVHILCTFPLIKDERDIAEKLNLKRETVMHALTQMKSQGLVEFKSGKWSATRKNIHISDNHPMISRHHFNWRFRAANQTYPVTEDEIQYTGVYSLSKKDLKKIKTMLNEAITSARKTALESSEEELINFNIDLIRV
ncbi:MAG: TIGR02147 family protein [Deltaproteobacteria bacterium]|nr:TIGR02147 family protein [Deltaproteobacteria bacterium]